VEVSISGEMFQSMMTAADGAYEFDNLTAGGDYTVTPYRNDDHDNGVTTFDIVLISKHVLGTQLLASPYQRIAADVNRSGTITTLDMIQIRKLILNITTEFPNNTSWRFVEAGYDFPDVEDPWAEVFPELYSVNNLDGVITDADFVAIKVGDVNGSARANSLEDDGRSLNGTFHLEMDEQELVAGNMYTVPVYASELAKVEGFQGTLELTGVELVDVVYGLANVQHFGLQYAERGVITMSYDRPAGLAGEDLVSSELNPLVQLVLRATTDQSLSEALVIGSRYTVAEAYSLGGEHRSLALKVRQKTAIVEQFELYQNTPNPVTTATLVSFTLPEAGEATLTISDMTGRTILLHQAEYGAGFQTINITKAQLQGVAGVLNYTLTAGEHTTTKQMVVVK
ncbi:MAG: T9SS C-terminal target domain-containing protein, partial [Bacteroidetes bacterium]